jgi:hypothetical protein
MSTDPGPVAEPDEKPIEAGEVGELRDLAFEEKRHRAETARSLANLLVWILGCSVALHYVMTVVLVIAGKDEASKTLATIFNAWLPAISSLVSAAATYYFTREKSRSESPPPARAIAEQARHTRRPLSRTRGGSFGS